MKVAVWTVWDTAADSASIAVSAHSNNFFIYTNAPNKTLCGSERQALQKRIYIAYIIEECKRIVNRGGNALNLFGNVVSEQVYYAEVRRRAAFISSRITRALIPF